MDLFQPLYKKRASKFPTLWHLNLVFYVPNLSCNLTSINHLIKNSNCFAKFFTSCVFQNLSSRKTISSVEECEELYYFNKTYVSENSQTIICSFISASMNDEFLLWHCRMRHPNFQYLKHLFLSIFSNKIINFHC